MQSLEKTPFLSPRNLPLWAGLTLGAIVAAMAFWPG